MNGAEHKTKFSYHDKEITQQPYYDKMIKCRQQFLFKTQIVKSREETVFVFHRYINSTSCVLTSVIVTAEITGNIQSRLFF